MTPTENTPEEIRTYVLSYLYNGRQLYARQWLANVLADIVKAEAPR